MYYPVVFAKKKFPVEVDGRSDISRKKDVQDRKHEKRNNSAKLYLLLYYVPRTYYDTSIAELKKKCQNRS